MKKTITVASLLLISNMAQARLKVVYGDDNRKDIYETFNATHLNLARSTAGMIQLAQFSPTSATGKFNIDSRSLQQEMNLCPSERFSAQPTAPACSGFLVGPDTLVTAGHCYTAMGEPEDICKSFGWVFDYSMKSPNDNPAKNISVKDVYLCKQVLAVALNENYDFAIVKLHRPVLDRAPLKFRKTGLVSDSTKLVVIGHPSGLPTKISDAGSILENTEPTRFSTSLDTFQGNSGSAVFDSTTGILEGILIQGRTDYGPKNILDPKSCLVANQCDEKGLNCSIPSDSDHVLKGEVVLRIDQIADLIEEALKL